MPKWEKLLDEVKTSGQYKFYETRHPNHGHLESREDFLGTRIPSIAVYDCLNEVWVEEQYHINGRLFGQEKESPAIVRRCPETGRVIEEAYYMGGTKSYYGGYCPSKVLYSPNDGQVIGEEWFYVGKQTRRNELSSTWRTDEPTNELPSTWRMDEKTGVITREEYWYDGERHRLDGPALIRRDADTGEITQSEWHIDGVRIPDQDEYNFAPFEP